MTRDAVWRIAATLALAVSLPFAGTAEKVTLPLANGSTRFAVIGDTGTGDRPQCVALSLGNQSDFAF